MAAAALRLILGDQLSPGIAALRDLAPERDVVMLCEVAEEAAYVPHHPKKIALILSAMRHFAAELRARGVRVRYVALDDPANRGSFTGEVARAIEELAPQRLIVTHPGEYRVAVAMGDWAERFGLPVEIREDDRFLCSRADFAGFARDRSGLRMEHFYRWMRRRTGLLMRPDGTPDGEAWNFDRQNRKPLPKRIAAPQRPVFAPDRITGDVLRLVRDRFAGHFGDLEPFSFAVTAEDAEQALAHFLSAALPSFGDYQDAMKRGEDTLFHAVISPYLNIGLLDPLAVCRRAVAEYHAGRAPLNAVEGFLRQILGWREYVRGLYWLKMPGYAQTNALGADRALPDFYWTGETDMACMAACIGQTRREAYAHHIQRLMVTGNFALLVGVAPAAVEEWYLAVYADAFEWVELPNTHGMALFADGGILGSKPYCASGNYIQRMSDYCQGCRYDPKRSLGPDACPFTLFYWAFLLRHEKLLRRNQRIGPILGHLDRMDAARRKAITAEAESLLDRWAPRPPGASAPALVAGAGARR